MSSNIWQEILSGIPVTVRDDMRNGMVDLSEDNTIYEYSCDTAEDIMNNYVHPVLVSAIMETLTEMREGR